MWITECRSLTLQELRSKDHWFFYGSKRGNLSKCFSLKQECYKKIFWVWVSLLVTRCLFKNCFDLQVTSIWAVQVFVAGNFCISYLCLLMLHIYSMLKQIVRALPSVSLRSCVWELFVGPRSLSETGILVRFLFMYSIVRALVEMLQSW